MIRQRGKTVTPPPSCIYEILRFLPYFCIWHSVRMRSGPILPELIFWKWSNEVKINEIGIFWCISITNNAFIIMQKIQWKSTNGIETLLRRPIFDENSKNKNVFLLNVFSLVWPNHGIGTPCESWCPGHSENVVLFKIWRF